MVDHRRLVPGGGTEERLTALARDCERNNRRLRDHDTMLADLAAACADLAAQLEGEERERPRSWLAEGGPTEPAGTLADLLAWLGRVYLRYPGAALPSCWLWHPWLVEELLWLRHAHHAAYDGPRAAWAKAADWHDRMRPGVVRRIADGAGSCELLCHTSGGPAARPAPMPPLTTAVGGIAAWAAAGLRDPAPAPTADQLADADRTSRTERHR
ncbi:MAG: hypothetical protein QOC93_2289 [Actinomycetota bacterium]|jgi:hypothetical protein|nr:hypothetical protein [Actinomycetota bacterium]